MSKYILNSASRKRVLEAISQLHPGRPWSITVEPHVERRTTEQNARLWALHTKAAEVTGYTPAEMHELALAHYYGCKRLQLGDDAVIWKPKQRSSGKDRKQFAEFMMAIEEWYVTELGVWLEADDGDENGAAARVR